MYHSIKVSGLNPSSIKFACSAFEHLDFLPALLFFPTVQKHVYLGELDSKIALGVRVKGFGVCSMMNWRPVLDYSVFFAVTKTFLHALCFTLSIAWSISSHTRNTQTMWNIIIKATPTEGHSKRNGVLDSWSVTVYHCKETNIVSGEAEVSETKGKTNVSVIPITSNCCQHEPRPLTWWTACVTHKCRVTLSQLWAQHVSVSPTLPLCHRETLADRFSSLGAVKPAVDSYGLWQHIIEVSYVSVSCLWGVL